MCAATKRKVISTPRWNSPFRTKWIALCWRSTRIDRIPSLQVRGAPREALLNEQLDCRNYAYEYGIDKPEIVDWRWPL